MKQKKLTAAEFNSGKTEVFSEIIPGTNFKIMVELYKDLGNYFVDYVNEKDKAENHTYSFGSLSQARPVFNDKVKIAKLKIEKEKK